MTTFSVSFTSMGDMHIQLPIISYAYLAYEYSLFYSYYYSTFAVYYPRATGSNATIIAVGVCVPVAVVIIVAVIVGLYVISRRKIPSN